MCATLRSVEAKHVTDIPYRQGVQRYNKCLSRALELCNSHQGWRHFSVRATSITGALADTWMCTSDRQMGRQCLSTVLVNSATKIRPCWEHFIWMSLSHIKCSFFDPSQIHPCVGVWRLILLCIWGLHSSTVSPKCHQVSIIPNKTHSHRRNCRNCSIIIPSKSLIYNFPP